MAQDNFVDHVILHLQSGKGGDGVTSWRREKYVAEGGPAGGDGGRGGHVIIRGNAQRWTLLDLRYRKFIRAENGHNGGKQRKTGRSGADEILEVPVGTIAKDADTGELLCEILEDGQEEVLLPGGHGGLGNWHFRSSTNQTPERSTPGGPAVERRVVLELKVLADVGLVGFPNVGKSTLLAALSAAKPEIADYPFTTIRPNLGIVAYRDAGSYVMADIPGIIEGAAEGKGLGTRFLRHIERNAVLLFVLPVDADDLHAEYAILLDELKRYNPELLGKPRLLALSKADLLDDELKHEVRALEFPLERVLISAVSGYGLEELNDKLWALLQEQAEAQEEDKPLPELPESQDETPWPALNEVPEGAQVIDQKPEAGPDNTLNSTNDER